MGKSISPEVMKQIEEHVFAGNKIAAIKLYREHSGEGLKEAKDFVDEQGAKLRIRDPGKFTARPASKGCLNTIAMCGFGALAVLIAVFVLRK